MTARAVTGVKRRKICLWALLVGALFLFPAPAHAAFPGQNGKIAFTAGGIYTINPDGSDRKFLIHGSYPSWSADGTKLAFVGDLNQGWGIYVMNGDGTGVTQVIGGTSSLKWPTWAPDGKHIVYEVGPFCHTDECFASHLRIVGTDGGGASDLPSYGGGSAEGPKFSPDGERIAFWKQDLCCHTFPPDDFGVWTMRLDGSNRTLLADRGTYPSWSPDGSKLVFGTGVDYDPSSGNFQQLPLRAVGADGQGLGPLGTLPGNHPAWSPDGSELAFASATAPCGSTFVCRSDLYVMNTDGTGPLDITNAHEPIWSVDWQPIPNRPPDCSHASASPNVLWPPNHKLVPLSVSGVTDPDGDPVAITVSGVTQDEPTSGSPDAMIGPGSNQLSVRAERAGSGDGRVYRIAIRATDGRGGECTGDAKVSVPHSNGGAAFDSAPPGYDSLGG